MFALGAVTIMLLIRSNRRFRMKKMEDTGDELFQTILSSKDKDEETMWNLLLRYITAEHRKFMAYAADTYGAVTEAFVKEDVKTLGKAENGLMQQKKELKNARRKETLCLRMVGRRTAIEKSAWFHLGNNCCMSILYNLRRINEICKEHVENNFFPLPEQYTDDFKLVRTRVSILFNDTIAMIDNAELDVIPTLRRHCEEIKDMVSEKYHVLYEHLSEGDPSSMTVVYVYFNMLQETREMLSTMHKYLRAYAKLHDTEFTGRTS